MSIRLNLILFIIAPVALVLLAAGTFALRAYEGYLERRMQEDVELVARALQMPMGRAIERGHEGVLERALESVGNIHRVFGLYIYDEDGELITSSGDVGLDPTGIPQEQIGDPYEQQREYSEVSGRRVYNYFVPLMDSGNRVIGLLHVTRRASEIDASIGNLRERVALLAIIVLAIIGALVVIGHRAAIGRPLHRLRESMRRVEEGDRRHRASAEGPAEIREVARTLNDMLNGLEQAEREILEQREQQWRLEQRLKHTEKLAAIGQLAAGVAHELGTPLAVIDGKAQRALRQDGIAEADRQVLQDIRAQVQRTELIVRQLLDFGRRHTLSIRTASPYGIIKSAAEAATPRATAADTLIQIVADPTERPIDVDPLALERVLTNLIDNAIDASPGGRITIRYLRDLDRARFLIDDSGPGIPEEDRSRVLEPFYTTKDVGQGTGLGLSVAHGIVQEHGGTMSISDSADGGASIEIDVPLRQDSPADEY